MTKRPKPEPQPIPQLESPLLALTIVWDRDTDEWSLDIGDLSGWEAESMLRCAAQFLTEEVPVPDVRRHGKTQWIEEGE